MKSDFMIVEITQEYIDMHPLLSRYMETSRDRTGRKYISKDGDFKCWYMADAVLRELPPEGFPEFYV